MEMADKLAKSRLVPKDLQGKPEDIIICIMTGYELGLSPFQSLRGINVINGKPTLAADLIAGLVLRDGAAEFFRPVDSNDESATYETLRRGQKKVITMTFDKAMAQTAGLWGKGPWRTYPAAMLRARCATALARAVYPDTTFGLYDPEELGAHPATEELPPTDPTNDQAPDDPTAVPPEPPPKKKRKRRTKKEMEAARAAEAAKKAHDEAKANGYQPQDDDEPPHDPETGEVIEDAEVIELADHRGNGEMDWEAEVVDLLAELARVGKDGALALLPRLKKLPDEYRPNCRPAFQEAMDRG
jgi:hypothetical protein